MEDLKLRTKLDAYYLSIRRVIVDRQHPVSGLLPASTAVTNHGDYTDAWVRDNVYSILAVWGLSMAYRRLDDDAGRGRELEHRTVHLMRGLLRSMMAQAPKVEAFKKTRQPRDALHAKYDSRSGETVVGDDAWGHLQIDATSVYLLILAQMIASGLDIIWTRDEVAFVQNLVYYIERAYRVPDYGIWERGAKSNSGRVELNASSLGMAKAALEALAGFNLWGARGSHETVIHVSPDNVAQCEITLASMLPRESHSKEVDAAVLSIIGYPAYAVLDSTLVERTRSEILEKLEGRYGLKRFLRDGHQTVVEDDGRLHYEAEELKQFEHIESEWPLFFAYLYLDALLTGDAASAAKYKERLKAVEVEQNGEKLLPELYIVPEEAVEAERARPGSQARTPNENVPLVWTQSLYFLGLMLQDGVLHAGDIDPLGRRLRRSPVRPVVQLLFLSEDEDLQAEMLAHGVRTETLEDLSPVEAYLPDDIARAHGQVGRSDVLGLSGRSARALKSLTTSRIYQLDGKMVVCLAPFFLQQDFFLAYDLEFVVRRFEAEVAYLARHWSLPGRPTVSILLTRSLLATDRTPFFELMQRVHSGKVGDVAVRQGLLRELLPTASFERLDGLGEIRLPQSPVEAFIHPPHALRQEMDSAPLNARRSRAIEAMTDPSELVSCLAETRNLYEQIEVLETLQDLLGPDASLEIPHGPLSAGARGRARTNKAVSLRDLVVEVFEEAGRARVWGVVRRAAGLLKMVDVDLSLACAALLVAHKNIQVGRAYSSESLITDPLPDHELLERIDRFCREDVRDRVLTQEILLYLGILVRSRPELFRELITVRVSHLIGVLTGELSREKGLPVEDAYDLLLQKAPSRIQQRLESVLERYGEVETLPQQLEHLGARGSTSELSWSEDLGLARLQLPKEGWLVWRQARGVIDRRPEDFYEKTWELFQYCPCIVIGDKLDRRNRVESSLVLSDMTPGERSFALLLEHLLNKVASPEYRQLNVEALTLLSSFFEQNSGLALTDALYLDALIGHAVRQHYVNAHPKRAEHYDQDKVCAWDAFYAAPPAETSAAMVRALRHLLGAARAAAAQ